MSMQTTSLPIQVSPGSPTQNLRANASLPNDGVNFSAALTQKINQQQINQQQINQRQAEQRQLDQRQSPAQPQPQPTMAPPQAVAAPKPQAAAKPAANETKAPAREAAREPAKESAQAADKADAPKEAEARTAAAEGASTDEAASAPGARAADAVVDMLAMVASFNQIQQAASAPAAVETAAAQAGALSMVTDALKGKLGAEPVSTPDAGAALAATADQAQEKAAPGIDLRALDLGKAGESAKLPVEAGDFASRLHDSVAQAAAAQPAPAVEALASLATQASALQNAQAAGNVPTDRLSARVGTPAWDNQVGQKVIWMVGGEDQSATLELNPPDLGPVQVVLNVSNDMASVTFSAQQLEVRQALENALPRLREMMNDSGIALGNATVNAGAEGRQGQDGKGSGRPGSGNGGNGGGDSAVAEAAPRQRSGILGGAGAVDTFA